MTRIAKFIALASIATTILVGCNSQVADNPEPLRCDIVAEVLANKATLDLNQFEWTRAPKSFAIGDSVVEIITDPGTDLWQRTYYHFRNDNAPALQIKTREKYFILWSRPTSPKAIIVLTSAA